MTDASPENAESPPTEDRSQFTLREMLLAITVLAALIAFLRVFGIFGALFVWGAVLFYSVFVQRRKRGSARRVLRRLLMGSRDARGMSRIRSGVFSQRRRDRLRESGALAES
jgi:hypothetical protein